MTHYRRLRLALLLLFALAMVLPAAQPSAAQEIRAILCYQWTPNVTIDCDNLASAGEQADPPWRVSRASISDFAEFTLSDFVMLAISRESATYLTEADLERIRDYVRGGGKLLLLDPAVAGLLDETLAAPQRTMITREIIPELTRHGLFTPGVGQRPNDLPQGNTGFIVPIQSLGEAWIPQTRVGSGEHSATTLASALLGQGRVVMAPAGLNSVDVAALIGFWTCCITLIGPDLSVNAIEVTQAIQDLDNSVRLLAGKRTYVRVHVSSPTVRSGVTATLSARYRPLLFGPYIVLPPVLTPINPGGTITVKPSPNRALLHDSFLFELPASWRNLTGQFQFTARIDPANTVNDLNTSNNLLTTTISFLSGPTMHLRIYNVRYTVGNNTHLATNLHLNNLENW
ncbi:MAG: hypothetical protein EI684_06060, partial [Candidatus Viridilinea halotolerans]